MSDKREAALEAACRAVCLADCMDCPGGEHCVRWRLEATVVRTAVAAYQQAMGRDIEAAALRRGPAGDAP